MSDVILNINSNRYEGWTEIAITRSLENAADLFTLTLTDRWADGERRPVAAGSPCQVLIGAQKIITGYIDEVVIEHDHKDRTINISGRSKVADIIDCSLPTAKAKSQYKNQSYIQLARHLCGFFDIEVVDEVGLNKPIQRAVLEQGQTVFAFLEEQARPHAVRLVSNTEGNLVITRSGTGKIDTALVLGENILRGSGNFSMQQRFSHYYFTAQMWGSDDNNGENAAHILGSSEDTRVRYRPTVLQAEGALNREQAKTRAEWQRNVAYGRSQYAIYVVSGWKHKDGLWEPNCLVRVSDPYMGLNDVWMMITSVRYVLDDKGRRAEIAVMPPEAFDLVPLPIESDESMIPWSAF